MTRISPSLLSADFSKLGSETERVDRAGADWIHLDVMDGEFVPNITFGPPVIAAIRRYTEKPFDAHLMIREPIRYVRDFAKAGCDILTVHAEACADVAATISAIREAGMRPGLALKPDTPAISACPYLTECDLVLVMAVHPGFGGQSFIPECLDRIAYFSEWARKHRPALEISVDGGINAATAVKSVNAGATVLVAGSFLFATDDMSQTVTEWKRLGKNAGERHGCQSLPDSRSHGD